MGLDVEQLIAARERLIRLATNSLLIIWDRVHANCMNETRNCGGTKRFANACIMLSDDHENDLVSFIYRKIPLAPTCSACNGHRETLLRTEREKLWNMLPEIFSLPPWEELLKETENEN